MTLKKVLLPIYYGGKKHPKNGVSAKTMPSTGHIIIRYFR
jgi:hypothetical protein